MTTTNGYIRQIKFILSNDQHVVHNAGNVVDLLREVAIRLEEEQTQCAHWVSECANMEMQRNRCREEIVRLRGALNQIAWPGAVPHPGIQTEREIAIDALAIAKL